MHAKTFNLMFFVSLLLPQALCQAETNKGKQKASLWPRQSNQQHWAEESPSNWLEWLQSQNKNKKPGQQLNPQQQTGQQAACRTQLMNRASVPLSCVEVCHLRVRWCGCLSSSSASAPSSLLQACPRSFPCTQASCCASWRPSACSSTKPSSLSS